MDMAMDSSMETQEPMVSIEVPQSVAEAIEALIPVLVEIIKNATGEVSPTEDSAELEGMEPAMEDNASQVEALKKRVIAGEQMRG